MTFLQFKCHAHIKSFNLINPSFIPKIKAFLLDRRNTQLESRPGCPRPRSLSHRLWDFSAARDSLWRYLIEINHSVNHSRVYFALRLCFTPAAGPETTETHEPNAAGQNKMAKTVQRNLGSPRSLRPTTTRGNHANEPKVIEGKKNIKRSTNILTFQSKGDYFYVAAQFLLLVSVIVMTTVGTFPSDDEPTTAGRPKGSSSRLAHDLLIHGWPRDERSWLAIFVRPRKINRNSLRQNMIQSDIKLGNKLIFNLENQPRVPEQPCRNEQQRRATL